MAADRTQRAGSARRRRLAPNERRELILGAAMEEFAAAGYDGASLRTIARRAGITTPVLYDHFASKTDLYVTLVEREAAALRAHQERPRDLPVGTSLARALFEDFFAWVRANPVAWRMLFRDAPAEGEVAAALARARAQATEQIASFVALAPSLRSAAGVERAVLDELVGQAIYGVLDRLSAWGDEHPEVSTSALADVAFELVWEGLGTLTGLRDAAAPGA